MTTDEETKCFCASMTILAVPTLAGIILAKGRWVAALMMGYLLIGGFVSYDLSKVGAKLLSKTNKYSEAGDWLKAYGITLGLLIALALVLWTVFYIFGIMSDFREFLRYKYGK